ncbi:ABC transporter permease [Gluconobacter sp. OJB]|uniref:ABC transporter permease n=1 Tax=Gluconobacter sp. OJB TaxID=3145196 RepID=UPI0031F9E142
MLFTILRSIIRQARRQPLYLALNVLGLGLGMGGCLVLTLQVRYEYNFNATIPDAAHILRLDSHLMFPGSVPQEYADVPFIAFPFLRADFPQIADATRYETEDYQLHNGDRSISADDAMVDPSFFNVIALPLEHGNPRSALSRPDAIILSANTAQALFGTADVLGRTLTTDHEGHHSSQTVTGVLARAAGPVTIAPDAITPFPSDEMQKPQFTRWGSSSGNIFLRVRNEADRTAIARNLTRFVIDHASGTANDDSSEGVHPERRFVLSLVSLRETHFSDLHVVAGDDATDRSVVNILALIGVLALLLAVLNAINLATTHNVLTLMLGDFLRPVLLACVMAAFPALFVMLSWLSGFHQRIALSWLDFAAVVLVTLLIAALTVLGQTLRLARAEPARALRAE